MLLSQVILFWDDLGCSYTEQKDKEKARAVPGMLPPAHNQRMSIVMVVRLVPPFQAQAGGINPFTQSAIQSEKP